MYHPTELEQLRKENAELKAQNAALTQELMVMAKLRAFKQRAMPIILERARSPWIDEKKRAKPCG